jgi:hypothetical protein
MNDYFDELESGLRDAVRRRAYLPWYGRLGQLSGRHRGLAALVAVFVIATPAVAAVGAASGWFSKGSSPIYYPASANSGLGKVPPRDGRLLPVRVADPNGGPPWGIRLVKTTRRETCIQVGRVVDGQIGQLGIDTAWHDDHEFHEIKPNDQMADICGATDDAGHGFVDQAVYGAPASVDIPLDNSSGAPNACIDPYTSLSLPGFVRRGGKLTPFEKRVLSRIKRQRRADGDCPLDAMRMIFVGLLGPDAKSVTYKTPSGQTRTQRTLAGTGAYLIVFRETASDCLDFAKSPFTSGDSCGAGNTGPNPYLQAPSAITKVTYADGKSCSDQPSATLTAAYVKLGEKTRRLPGKRARQVFDQFLTQHHLHQGGLFNAIEPSCNPVGWVAPRLPKLTAAKVTSPIKLTVSEGIRFCSKATQMNTFNGAVPCDKRVPAGDRSFAAAGPGQTAVLVTVSFTARQAVTTANSYYEWNVKNPGNHGGGGGPLQQNIRAGQRITLSQFVGSDLAGTYRGTVAFVQDAGRKGSGYRHLFTRYGERLPPGTFVVGHFSFKLPLKR